MTAARSTHSGSSCRYVFQRVHGEVYLARKEGLVELAGEDVSLVYDGERRVGVVLAGRPDDSDLDLDAGGAQAGCALFGLNEGEPGAAGTEDSRCFLGSRGFAGGAAPRRGRPGPSGGA